MADEPKIRRGLFERAWQTGILQAGVYDVAIMAGLGVVGHGIWRWSAAAAEVYGGLVVAGLSLLLAIERRRADRRGGN